jgi:hypothetical protein
MLFDTLQRHQRNEKANMNQCVKVRLSLLKMPHGSVLQQMSCEGKSATWW